MPSKLIYIQRDFDNDRVQTGITLSDATTEIEAAGLRDNIDFWTAGADGGAYFQSEITADGGAAASSPVAQGALRAVVEMVDDVTGKSFKEFLPMPDLNKADDVGTNPAFTKSGGLTVFNPLHAEYAPLANDFAAHWESPDGNAGTVSRIYIEE